MVLCCMVHSVPCSANALCIHRNLCYVGLTQQCIPTKNCIYISWRVQCGAQEGIYNNCTRPMARNGQPKALQLK